MRRTAVRARDDIWSSADRLMEGNTTALALTLAPVAHLASRFDGRDQGLASPSHVATPPWCEQVPRRFAEKEYVPSRHSALAPDGAVRFRGASRLRDASGGAGRAGGRAAPAADPIPTSSGAARQRL